MSEGTLKSTFPRALRPLVTVFGYLTVIVVGVGWGILSYSGPSRFEGVFFAACVLAVLVNIAYLIGVRTFLRTVDPRELRFVFGGWVLAGLLAVGVPIGIAALGLVAGLIRRLGG